MIGDRDRNTSVFEYATVYVSTFLDVRRNEDCRNANTQAIEGKGHTGAGIARLGGESVCRTGGRDDVVVSATVFVVNDEQSRALKESIVLPDSVVDHRDKALAFSHVVRWMLVGRQDFAAARTRMIVIRRLD